jgi:hypothetical protein
MAVLIGRKKVRLVEVLAHSMVILFLEGIRPQDATRQPIPPMHRIFTPLRMK